MASPARTRRRSLLRSRRPRRAAPGGTPIEGRARLGRRTKDLVKRISPGDVAVVDHTDIDRIAAEELVATGAVAVVNVSRSSTGRYPNAGPLLLARAGVCLLDAPGAPLFEQLDDGDHVSLDGGEVRSNGQVVARGRVLEAAELAEEMERQRDRIDEALAAFAENTIAHIRQERDLLTGRVELPETRTRFRDRHVLIVVRGTTHRRDLRAL